MRFDDILSIYAPAYRKRMLFAAAAMILAVAVVDWQTQQFLSVGYLYLFPLMIAGGFLSRPQIVGVGLLCAYLQEEFSYLPSSEAITRLVLSSAGFVGTGLLIAEVVHSRRIMIENVRALEASARARREAEEQLRVLVESSPAAIVTMGGDGTILLANDAAQQMLAPDGPPLNGQSAERYLPALTTAARTGAVRNFRTTLQCRGQRADGEVFLAGVWFSTYAAAEGGKRLAAILVDLSDELRSREDLNLDYLLTNTRILMSAVSHEIRNLCGAAMIVHRNLCAVEDLRGNADFEALGTLIQGLEKIASMELSGKQQPRTAIELDSVLDEVRVLVESAAREEGIGLRWEGSKEDPMVWADRYGLMQVFLNLSKNAIHAMQGLPTRRLTVAVDVGAERVTVRFLDTGPGIADASQLFRPFHTGSGGTGLGLYVSRAMLKSFGGDLVYEPREIGCSFAVVLERAKENMVHD
ncbi:MAG: ATP-binding protein [Acidobacteriota bacterium]|nr:ATP-binding protein [Acidobacteriota bacterium]